MPVGRALVLLAALGGTASAQEPGEDRFFFVAEESEDEREKTAYDGSLTSTTFYYREDGSQVVTVRNQAPALGLDSSSEKCS